MSSPPAAPPPADPVATAAAQGKMNKETAVSQTGLNATNQVGPDGSLTYSQTDNWADGTPHFTATQSLSPEQQAIHDVNASNSLKLGTVGGEQIDKVAKILASPVDLSKAPAMPTFNGDTSAIEGRINELASKRLNPELDRRRSALETKLANSGITMGSEAWRNATTQQDQSDNDALTQLLLQGRGQAFNELGSTYGYNMQGHQQGIQDLLTERQTPIDEITALTSGSQVSRPNWVGTPQTSVAPTDYSGLVMNKDQMLQKQYAADMAAHGAMMGGLFGLGGTAMKAGVGAYTGKGFT